MTLCSIPNCDRPRGYIASGYCMMHENRARKGLPMEPLARSEVPVEDRFWAKVDKTDPSGCWIWTAATVNGYGQFGVGAYRVVRAHRFAWQLTGRQLTPGLVLDHLCRNRACVNPAHLREITRGENVLAPGSLSLPAINARKTHCKGGHLYTAENTYISPQGKRVCRTCRLVSNKAAA